MIFAEINRVEKSYGCYGLTRGGGKIKHGGIDIDTLPNMDKTVHSTVSGKVVTSTIVTDKSNRTWEWGHYVCVQDTEGYKHYFCHLASRTVVVGQQVAAGDVLGVMGKTGNAALDSQAEHVHYEVRNAQGVAVDPTPWCGIPNEVGQWDARAVDSLQLIVDSEGQNTRPPNGGHPLYERGLGAEQITRSEEKIMPASTKAVRMWFGAMSAGDAKRFDEEFKRLGVDYVDENGVLSTKQAISPDEQTVLMKLATDVGNIGYGVVAQSGEVPRNEYDKLAAEFDALTAELTKANQYIKQAQAALQEAARELGVQG